MNRTLQEILEKREDLSEYIFHFTKGKNAFTTLCNIIESNKIIDVKLTGYICFTEAPLILLLDMFEIFARYEEPMFSPYGIAIKKDEFFKIGGRPVIYGTKDDLELIDDKIKWRFVEYIPQINDFSWLREWRINNNYVELNNENCFLITQEDSELDHLTEIYGDIIDIYFDGCVSDGQFDGNAYGTIKKKFKGISIEMLSNLKTPLKKEMNEVLDKQNLDNTTVVDLGYV